MRDELGLKEASEAKPVQAGMASACSFLARGVAPLVVRVLFPGPRVLDAIIAPPS